MIDSAYMAQESPWAFLKAPRFWVMLIGCVFAYLETKGLVGEDERNLMISIAALFISIRTIDRTVDKLA